MHFPQGSIYLAYIWYLLLIQISKSVLGEKFTCGFFIGGWGMGIGVNRGGNAMVICIYQSINPIFGVLAPLINLPKPIGSKFMCGYYIWWSCLDWVHRRCPKIFGAPKGQTLETMGGAT